MSQSEKVSDEMLMAYVDGELDPPTAERIRILLERDPELRRRAAAMEDAKNAVQALFAGVLGEPAPAPLVRTIETSGRGRLLGFPARRRSTDRSPAWRGRPVAALLAASLVVVVGAGAYLAGLSWAPAPAGSLFAATTLAEPLSQAPSGQVVAIAAGEGRLTPLATYRIDGGLCRSFEAVAGTEALRGVACDRGSGWAVEMTVAIHADGAFSPASDGAAEAIDTYLSASEASAPLAASEEADALRAGRAAGR